ncbi:hypothetical protein AMECASPLE_012551 [Ameca splendens]|uniref:Uncharacterized protein n=2 Tax=Goodeidae TaxID=28758 RepID=A0ABU7BYM5_9TELE|nr:hypothetical protein [Ataeniobius toweri]
MENTPAAEREITSKHSGKKTNKTKTILTQAKLRRRFSNSAVSRAEATSLPAVFLSFSEVVRKCSNNSRPSQLRRGKQRRFQPSSCPKKLQIVLCIYLYSPSKPKASFPRCLTRVKRHLRLL